MNGEGITPYDNEHDEFLPSREDGIEYLRGYLELSEGNIVMEGEKHIPLNLRESYFRQIAEDPANPELVEHLKPGPTFRDVVLIRIGDRHTILNVRQAYEEVFLPEKRARLNQEFEDKEALESAGGRYTRDYYTLVKDIDSAEAFVKYLGELEQQLIAKEEEENRIADERVDTQAFIESLRADRILRGFELSKIFKRERISLLPKSGEQRDTSLILYAGKLGDKLDRDHYAQINDEERADIHKSLAKFKNRVFELFPDRVDRELLLEEYISLETKAEKELRDIYIQSIMHELSDDERDAIDQKRKILDDTSSIVRVLTRSL